MTLGDVSVSQADPANDDFYTGTDFQLNGSRIDTSLDDDPFNPPVIFNTGFDGTETAVRDSTYRAVTFTPQGYGAPVTGLLEITVGPSEGAVGDDPFRTISFTRLLWDDATTITTLPAGTPTRYGSTAEVGGVSVFTRALSGLFQITLVGNVLDSAGTPVGTTSGLTLTAPESSNPWFSDLTGNGAPDFVLTDARFFDDGDYRSITIMVNGSTYDTSIEFDFIPSGYIYNSGFDESDAEDTVAHVPLMFTPIAGAPPVNGLLEITASGHPYRRISFTRLVWDTASDLASLPAETPVVYGSTAEVAGASVFTRNIPTPKIEGFYLVESAGELIPTIDYVEHPDYLPLGLTISAERRLPDGTWSEVAASVTASSAVPGKTINTLTLGSSVDDLGPSALLRLSAE